MAAGAVPGPTRIRFVSGVHRITSAPARTRVRWGCFIDGLNVPGSPHGGPFHRDRDTEESPCSRGMVGVSGGGVLDKLAAFLCFLQVSGTAPR